uniref:type VI secretion system tip protein TssI/VgrG n=1 Tax=Enterobacterales TaxID=91347 RepID=UPI002ED89E2C
PSSVQMQDYTFKVPGWPGRYDQAGEHLNGQWQQYEIYDYPGRYKDEQHGADFARYRMEGWRSDAETATGTSNSPVLWPGVRFNLTGHPTSALNREWQVVSSLLSGDQPQALHGSQGSGTTLTNQFSVIPADRTWRMPPRAKPRVDGPQSAVVTGPEGEEIFCDEHGRIRVKFIWDRYHGCTEDSSCWIRVSQAWAGAGFGNLAIPRVGQEVIVDFLNGDPDQPVVMGRTYHEDNRPPGDLPLTKTQMTVRSKTYKGSGFNELTFEDATGQERVYLHAQKDMDTEVLNNRSTDVKADHTETIGHDQKISVVHDQDLAVQNDQTVSVRHDRMANISHNDGLYVANDRKVTVDGTQHHKTSGDHISLVAGKYSLQVNSELAQKISGALGIKAQGEMVLDSASKITLKVGSSFVVISPSGVDISAPVINLNSGGSPGSVVQTVQPAVLKALEEEGHSQDDDGANNTGSEANNPTPGSDDENNSDQYSLRFALSEDLINEPYILHNKNGDILSQGTLPDDGRTPRLKFDKPDELNLIVGTIAWNMTPLSVGDSAQDTTLGKEIAFPDPWFDKLNVDYGDFFSDKFITKIIVGVTGEE